MTHDIAMNDTVIAAALTLNVTLVTSGDAVRVSWASAMASARPAVDLALLPPMRTAWRPVGDGGEVHVEHECIVTPDALSTSYWVGQFAPAVTSADMVDMIGQSYISTPPFTSPAPVKFISGTQLAPGHFDFVVTNMRTAVNWVLFQGSLTNASDFAVVALSPVVTFADVDAPMHGRLARTSSTDEMRISWTTSAAGAHADPTVMWGSAADALTRVARAAPQTQAAYAAADLCGAPASTWGFHDPGRMFTSVMDLSQDSAAARLAGKRYYYKFGSPSAKSWSSVRSFLAPKPASPHASLSVILTADMGETYEDGSQYHWAEPNAVQTLAHISAFVQRGAELVMHPGDLSYATGYESEWDRFLEGIEAVASAAPYMTGQGNHERDFPGSGSDIGGTDCGGECGVPTQARFHMPTCAEPNTAPCVGDKTRSSAPALTLASQQARAQTPGRAPSPRSAAHLRGPKPTSPADDGWYSFEQGPAHFVMLNTEKSSLNASRQYTFIENDLAAVDRARTPWVFVLGHRQMYSGNYMAPQNALGDVEELLMRHKVDVAVWGHIHFAQASCAMYNATCVETKDGAGYDAPIHAVVGNAGQSLSQCPTPKAPWSLWNDEHFGFSHMTIFNATHLTFDFYTDAPIGTPPAHAHSFSIERSYPRVA